MGLFKKKSLEDLCPYRKGCAFKDKYYYCGTSEHKDCAVYQSNKKSEEQE